MKQFLKQSLMYRLKVAEGDFHLNYYSSMSISPLVHDFCVECIDLIAKDREYDSRLYTTLSIWIASVMNLALNTTYIETIKGKNLSYFKGTLDELKELYMDIINSPDDWEYYYDKIDLINEILEDNMEDMDPYCEDIKKINEGKKFEEYKSLYLIVQLINKNYDELLAKGFDLEKIWYPFAEMIDRLNLHGEKIDEEEKLNLFIGLINGTHKFHPMYRASAIGYIVKPIDFNKEIIIKTPTSYDNPISLPQTDITFEISDKGKKQKIIRKNK